MIGARRQLGITAVRQPISGEIRSFRLFYEVVCGDGATFPGFDPFRTSRYTR
jgi:hypothetical protein